MTRAGGNPSISATLGAGDQRLLCDRLGLVAKRFVAAALISALASGCVQKNEVRYPADWSPVQGVADAECPTIAGRYSDSGEVASSCSAEGTQIRAAFNCDRSLEHNWTDTRGAKWVEIQQPDSDTLVFVVSDPTTGPVEFHQSRGDYSCGSEGIVLSLTANVLAVGGNSPHQKAGMAAYNAAGAVIGGTIEGLGTYGSRHLKRRFVPAEDGSLVMSVTETSTGTIVLIPQHSKDSTFVRWERYTEPVHSEPDSDAPADASAAALFASYAAGDNSITPARYTQVARFTALGAGYAATDSGANEVDGEFTGLAKVVALQPGRHWIESDVLHHHFAPLRDFSIAYAYSLEVVADHEYHFESKPPACLPEGKIDAALESHMVYRTPITLIDSEEGHLDNRIVLGALCTSGFTPHCDSANTPADTRPNEACVHLDDSDRGFWGVEATAPPR